MPFVVDASVTAVWCFPDEDHSAANAALHRFADDHAVVPALWWFEIRNILVVNERRGRIDTTATAEFLADLAGLPIRIDRRPDSELVLALARKHALTAYDAAYLELARRQGGPLATLDRALAAAARAERVDLIIAPST
jgi:predicted nucleic acid-binding protein